MIRFGDCSGDTGGVGDFGVTRGVADFDLNGLPQRATGRTGGDATAGSEKTRSSQRVHRNIEDRICA